LGGSLRMLNMRYKLIFALLIICKLGVAKPSKFLIIEHRSKVKEVVIAQGEWVVVKTFNGETVRGEIQIISETLIRVKHKVVPLTSVKCIGKKNAYIQRVASLIVTNGVNLILFGLNENLRNGWDLGNGHKAGIPMLGLGVPLLTITHKRKAKNWKFIGQISQW
jgi:hypothetical protein